MRDFGPTINPSEYQNLLGLAAKVYASVPAKRQVTAGEFAMEENPERIVVKEVELKWDGERLRVAMSEPGARPPFEWLYEVSSDVGETDYFKHYLIRENDIVLAQRKVLTPIDAEEAEVLRADLQAALDSLKG
jgi:hypothetical protein